MIDTNKSSDQNTIQDNSTDKKASDNEEDSASETEVHAGQKRKRSPSADKELCSQFDKQMNNSKRQNI